MAVTIIEVLENAEHNLKSLYTRELGLQQLRNAIEALEQGHDGYTIFKSREDLAKEKGGD